MINMLTIRILTKNGDRLKLNGRNSLIAKNANNANNAKNSKNAKNAKQAKAELCQAQLNFAS